MQRVTCIETKNEISYTTKKSQAKKTSNKTPTHHKNWITENIFLPEHKQAKGKFGLQKRFVFDGRFVCLNKLNW